MEKTSIIESVKNKIHTIRGKQVILDEDLAKFYQIETRVFNQSVKRNSKRFPKEFMFQLTQDEYDSLRSQFATIEINFFLTSQSVISNKGGRRHLPYVFTEQGVSMLSAVLNSDFAIKMSIKIINAFVEMRHFISTNEDVFQRLNIVETKLLEHDNNFNTIFKLLESKKPEKGIFFEGQLFDAYTFISDVIRQAKQEIKLIDNYIDDKTLQLFTKTNVKITIYTKNITDSLKQDVNIYNQQYREIELKQFNLSHDRFLIIDNQVYHIGASLKDLGKKWFGFSKMDEQSVEILKRLE